MAGRLALCVVCETCLHASRLTHWLCFFFDDKLELYVCVPIFTYIAHIRVSPNCIDLYGKQCTCRNAAASRAPPPQSPPSSCTHRCPPVARKRGVGPASRRARAGGAHDERGLRDLLRALGGVAHRATLPGVRRAAQRALRRGFRRGAARADRSSLATCRGRMM